MRTTIRSLVCAVALAGPAWAGTESHDLQVRATVPQKCLISTSTINFGPYDPISVNASADLNGTAQATVTCTRSATAVTITLGPGSNASGSTRRMQGTARGGFLAYEIYQPSATSPGAPCSFPGTTVWGTSGPAAFTPTGTAEWGGSAAKQFSICATIPRGQDVPADDYQDSVVTTVDF